MIECHIKRPLLRPCIRLRHKDQGRRSQRRFIVENSIRNRGQQHENKRLFIFGLGYTGTAALNYFRQKGWTVGGTTRDPDKAAILQHKGFDAYIFDTDGYNQLESESLEALHNATHVLSTVPPNGNHDPILTAHSQDFIASATSGDEIIKWMGYISSTSVYGDHEGAWVDEDSSLAAAHGKGLVRILSEAEWLALYGEYRLPVHIFRCGGIYGPRRSALDSVMRPDPPTMSQQRRSRQVYTSRVHVLDICRILEASMMKPNPGRVYNVVDDDPAGRGEVEGFAAAVIAEQSARAFSEKSQPGKVGALKMDSISSVDIAGYDEPVRVPEAVNNAASQAAAMRGEKRVKNDRIKKELGVQLEFPTYREGLFAIAQGDMRPFDE